MSLDGRRHNEPCVLAIYHDRIFLTWLGWKPYVPVRSVKDFCCLIKMGTITHWPSPQFQFAVKIRRPDPPQRTRRSSDRFSKKLLEDCTNCPSERHGHTWCDDMSMNARPRPQMIWRDFLVAVQGVFDLWGRERKIDTAQNVFRLYETKFIEFC